MNALKKGVVERAEKTAASAIGEDKDKKGEDVDDRVGTMYLCGAELFGAHYLKPTADSFRGVFSAVGEGFKKLVEVLESATGEHDVVLVGDGRDESCRKEIRDVLNNAAPERTTELWVVYDMEASTTKDIRLPKRKLPFSSDNLETIFVVLPKRHTGKKRKLVSRDFFAKSGEATNFSRSYTGVPFVI